MCVLVIVPLLKNLQLLAASELTRTSILYIMHLYNLLDFICIGVSHSNEKPPELTVTIPDAAPRGSIKHAVVYFLNSQAWLHAAHCSNHAEASFFFTKLRRGQIEGVAGTTQRISVRRAEVRDEWPGGEMFNRSLAHSRDGDGQKLGRKLACEGLAVE